MVEENLSEEFRLKNIKEIKNYFIKEINQKELMSKMHEKVCTTLNYIEHFLTLAFVVTECISIFWFCFFTWYSFRITSSAIRLKICAMTAGIKNYKSIIQKKKTKKYDEIVLLAKS